MLMGIIECLGHLETDPRHASRVLPGRVGRGREAGRAGKRGRGIVGARPRRRRFAGRARPGLHPLNGRVPAGRERPSQLGLRQSIRRQGNGGR